MDSDGMHALAECMHSHICSEYKIFYLLTILRYQDTRLKEIRGDNTLILSPYTVCLSPPLIPKSVTMTLLLDGSNKTLSGLRSECTVFNPCRYYKVLTIWRPKLCAEDEYVYAYMTGQDAIEERGKPRHKVMLVHKHPAYLSFCNVHRYSVHTK